MGMMQMLMGTASASSNIVDLADASITGTTSAYVTINTDGTLSRIGDSTTNVNWYSPTTTGIGSSYYVRTTKQIGDDLGPSDFGLGTLNKWVAITETRYCGYDSSQGTGRSGTYRVEIAASAGGAVLTSADYSFSI